MSTITVTVNGSAHAMTDGATLEDLVRALGHAANTVGTAVDDTFIARALRAGRVLRDGDVVLLFHPIVGG